MLRFAEYGVIASILQIKYTLVYLRNRLLSLLEIDSLVEGQRVLPTSLANLAEFDRNAWTAFHQDGRRKLRGWGWNETDALPIVSWKVEGDLSILVDLPLALKQAREFNQWDSLVRS